MLEKIRYRLVFNRQKKLNRQGTALVQVEAYLNQRKIYLKTNVYHTVPCACHDHTLGGSQSKMSVQKQDPSP